jgi:cell division protein FtsB
MSTADYSRPVPSSRPETISGMAISLIFWLCLLLACVLFALVSLAPKLQVYLQLRSQFDMKQQRLVALELQAEQLQRVIEAIRTDTDFAAELTRIEFDAVRPDEEVIPVDMALKLDARAVETPLPDMDAIHEWYEPIVTHLASDGGLRVSFLGAATLLVILSFTILQPARAEPISTVIRGRKSFWQNLHKRYARHA